MGYFVQFPRASPRLLIMDKPTPKKKSAAKPRPARPPKASVPVDLDKQCGVPLPTGGLCGRSLTCKTHSIGSKRAVKGRTQPFDILLTLYHQKKHVKQASKLTMAQQQNDEETDEAPLTDAEEVQMVLRGVMQSQPEPLSTRVILPTRTRTSLFKTRELLTSSVTRLPTADTNMITAGAVLGRAIIYNPETGQQTTRPSRIYAQRLAAARAAAAAEKSS